MSLSSLRDSRRTGRRGLSRTCLAGALAALLVLGAGCQGKRKSTEVQKPAQDTDVYKVLCFYPPNMWRSFDAEGDANAEGFSFVMYLVSRKTNKGIFADGTFHVEIYERGQADASGRRSRLLAFNTSVDLTQLPRRSPTMLGVGYQPSVFWGDVDIYGRDVELLIKYESPTGRIVPSETVHLKVPERKA